MLVNLDEKMGRIASAQDLLVLKGEWGSEHRYHYRGSGFRAEGGGVNRGTIVEVYTGIT